MRAADYSDGSPSPKPLVFFAQVLKEWVNAYGHEIYYFKFSESDEKAFVESAKAWNPQSELDLKRCAYFCHSVQIEDLRKTFLELTESLSPIEIYSTEFTSSLKYLLSLYDPISVTDFDSAVFGLVIGMNQFVQACPSISKNSKEAFKTEVERFLKDRKYKASLIGTRKIFVGPWTLRSLLYERLYGKFVLSPEKTQKEIIEACKKALKNAMTQDAEYLDLKKRFLELPFDSWTQDTFKDIFVILRSSKFKKNDSFTKKMNQILDLRLDFLLIFGERIEITGNYDNFFNDSNTGFKDCSFNSIFCESFDEIEGILKFCEENLKLDTETQLKIQKWKKANGSKYRDLISKNSKNPASGPLNSALSKTPKWLLGVIIVFILALIAAGVFFLHTKRQNQNPQAY